MKPDVTYTHDRHVFNYRDLEISLAYSEFRERDETMYLEVSTSRYPRAGLLFAGKFAFDALGGNSGMKTWIDRLNDRSVSKDTQFLEDVDWHNILLETKQLSLARWKKGEPSISLADVEPAGADKWLLFPFLQESVINIIYGDGGTGKSTLAESMAVSLAAGIPVLGMEPNKQINVMYLDWETEPEAHREIVGALCNGAGIPIPSNIRYRRMDRSLVASIRGIREEVGVHDIGLVIIDSVGMAGSGEPERAATKTDLFGALRTLKGCTILCLDHVAKGDQSSPYGSVYTRNTARLIWHVESVSDDDSNELKVALKQNKINRGRKIGRKGYSLEYDTDQDDILHRIDISSLDLMEVEEFAAKVPLWKRRQHELRHGERSVYDLADVLDSEVDSIRKALVRKSVMFQQSRVDKNIWQLKTTVDIS